MNSDYFYVFYLSYKYLTLYTILLDDIRTTLSLKRDQST